MADCPFCNCEYTEYTIVGVIPANEHLTDWLEPVPIAQLLCASCGRYTYMHPDHPDVQRLGKGARYEDRDNTRTLNVPIMEIGDPELRDQFIRGREDRSLD